MAKTRRRYVFYRRVAGPSRDCHIEIWRKSSESGKFLSVKAILVDSKTDDHIAERIRKTRSKDDAEVKIDYLVNILSQDYLQTHVAQANTMAESPQQTDAPYSAALNSLSDDEEPFLYLPSWRASTTKQQAMAYFRTTFLPLLDAKGLDVSPADRREIVNTMLERASTNGNAGTNHAITENKVRVHITNCQKMYDRLRSMRPELPEVCLVAPSDYKNIQNEQVKALPLAIQIAFAAIVFAALPSPLAMGALIMLLGGLRTAEACALCFKDFKSFSAWGTDKKDSVIAEVLFQIKNDERSSSLKTTHSFRVVLFGNIIFAALNIMRKHLLGFGFTAVEIEEMPIVCAPNDFKKFANPNDLSRYIRDLLTNLGCDADFWEAADGMMVAEPDYDESGERMLTDITAYVLRRNFCSMMINICGMDPDMVDALMGHKLPDTCKIDWYKRLKAEADWPKVAQQMSRWVLLPEHTTHPAFTPLSLTAKDVLDVRVAQTQFTLVATENIELDLQVETIEPGDRAGVYGQMIQVVKASSIVVNQYPPVIGPVYRAQLYQDLIRSALGQEAETAQSTS